MGICLLSFWYIIVYVFILYLDLDSGFVRLCKVYVGVLKSEIIISVHIHVYTYNGNTSLLDVYSVIIR